MCDVQFHHKSVGLTGGHHELFMIDRIAGEYGPAPMAGATSETSTVLNKFGPSGHGEAQVQYLDGDFRVDLARNLCALRGDRCADPARRIEILERRSAGGLRDPDRGAAAAFSGRAEDARLIAKFGSRAADACPPSLSELLLPRLKQPLRHQISQLRGSVELQRHLERHDIAGPSRKSVAPGRAAPDPFPSSPGSARRVLLPRSGLRSRLARTDGDRETPAPRDLDAGRAASGRIAPGSPIPANASTRRPKPRHRGLSGQDAPAAPACSARRWRRPPSRRRRHRRSRSARRCGRVAAAAARAADRRERRGHCRDRVAVDHDQRSILSHRGILKPSSIRITLAPRDRASATPSPRSRATPPAASAPTSAARRRHRPRCASRDRP